jgi:diguanylate cyclase (GGDEF)-like protein
MTRSIRSTPAPDTPPAAAAGPASARRDDGLAFYRLLASFPTLATYRAKLAFVIVAGTALPAFVLVLVLVLGAGRLSILGVLGVVVVLAAVACVAMLRALDRLLVPLQTATRAIDDLALGRPLERTELPGNDTAAQVLRGVQGLVARIENQAEEASRDRERDDLTGLYNRRTGRDRAQQLVDRECARGRVVRAVVADIDGFTAFNAAHGPGHGDALLKAIAARLSRLAGDDGVAARWHGDAFLWIEAASAGGFADAGELLGRPIVVKGSAEPLTLSIGLGETSERTPVDALVGRAESALAVARAALRARG